MMMKCIYIERAFGYIKMLCKKVLENEKQFAGTKGLLICYQSGGVVGGDNQQRHPLSHPSIHLQIKLVYFISNQ